MTTFLWIMAIGFVLGIILGIIFNALKKTALSLISICISAVCAAGFIVDITIEPVKNINPSVSVTSSTVEETYIDDVGFDEIYKAYKENELRAKDVYRYNRYRITAKINGMSTGGLFNLTGGATLTMETKVGKTIVFFYAEFEKDQEDNLKKVNVGDTITFEGECLDSGSWVKCEIVK